MWLIFINVSVLTDSSKPLNNLCMGSIFTTQPGDGQWGKKKKKKKKGKFLLFKRYIFSPIHMEVKESAQEQNIMVG